MVEKLHISHIIFHCCSKCRFRNIYGTQQDSNTGCLYL